jgi:hypothetical protein
MDIAEWSLIIGVVTSIALAVGPWMFKVHAKLAVIVSKLADLCDSVASEHRDHQELWRTCSKQTSRLDTHDVQLAHISERLRDVRGRD